ncbi:MAG TPA: 2'-5' RNA ligase family protein [Anaerolineaceae bacterium]|nr:2'-5' RNA ligase family protein [Anaerolineaceae bacterium]HPN51944.1 2'-5' RNA ligase family protein [Anaerolineaceae bacterium]
MKAALVLLADDAVQNAVRKVVVRLGQQTGLRFYAALLPAHISLKQPFPVDNLDKLDAYVDQLAASLAPFEVQMDNYYYEEWADMGILGLNVVETAALRSLHDRLNEELKTVVTDANAAHDGSGYHFHLTLEMAPLEQTTALRDFFNFLPDPGHPLQFTASKLAIFIYLDDRYLAGTFTTYRIVPLTGGKKPTVDSQL